MRASAPPAGERPLHTEIGVTGVQRRRAEPRCIGPGTKYHADGPNSCVTTPGGKPGACKAGVIRKRCAQRDHRMETPDGGQRTIFFTAAATRQHARKIPRRRTMTSRPSASARLRSITYRTRSCSALDPRPGNGMSSVTITSTDCRSSRKDAIFLINADDPRSIRTLVVARARRDRGRFCCARYATSVRDGILSGWLRAAAFVDCHCSSLATASAGRCGAIVRHVACVTCC